VHIVSHAIPTILFDDKIIFDVTSGNSPFSEIEVMSRQHALAMGANVRLYKKSWRLNAASPFYAVSVLFFANP
jgi:hypothetical protein